MAIEVRRVYDDPKGRKSEHRVLVDRLWPRGLSKEAVRFDDWAKDAAPTTDLRKWYGHDPDRFAEFSRRYRAELGKQPAVGAVDTIIEAAEDGSTVVLLTATKDVEHSGAHVLAAHIRALL